MHDVYGIDCSDPAVREGRSWRWFCNRVAGLLNRPEPTRIMHALAPPAAQEGEVPA